MEAGGPGSSNSLDLWFDAAVGLGLVSATEPGARNEAYCELRLS
jgi:hypothetical protein